MKTREACRPQSLSNEIHANQRLLIASAIPELQSSRHSTTFMNSAGDQPCCPCLQLTGCKMCWMICYILQLLNDALWLSWLCIHEPHQLPRHGRRGHQWLQLRLVHRRGQKHAHMHGRLAHHIVRLNNNMPMVLKQSHAPNTRTSTGQHC